MYGHLPKPPKPTAAECEAIKLDEEWNNAGRRGAPINVLSAADAADLEVEWRKVGHEKTQRASAKDSPKDPYAGMTDEQRADAILKARYEKSEAEKRAKAFSDRIDREMGDVIAKEVLSRRGYSA